MPVQDVCPFSWKKLGDLLDIFVTSAGKALQIHVKSKFGEIVRDTHDYNVFIARQCLRELDTCPDSM